MGLKKGPVLLMFAILLPAIFAACPVAAADARTEAVPVERSEGLPARGLIDLRSNFSDGAYDVETIVRMAKDRGFSVVIINDHDRAAMEYGLAPLRNVVKKREEKGSVNRWGASAWLQAIREAEKKHPDMVVIPGTESAPFYHWTGSPVRGDLTAWNHERRILTIGLDSAEDYQSLPVLHNGFTTRWMGMALPGIFAFLAALAAGAVMIRWKGLYRIAGIGVVAVSLVFLVNSDPFRSSPFDPYSGDQGIAPWQLLIDDVHGKGGLTFWNHVETQSGVRDMGPVKVHTAPHPEVLDESTRYTGFAVLYGDTVTVSEPGGLWDRVLSDYCRGYREHPAWGIATAHYHREGEAGEQLGNFQTGFFVEKLSRRDVLEALRTGKTYAYRGSFPKYARLDEFSVSPADGGKRAISGEQIVLKGNPVIRIRVSGDAESPASVSVRLIRSGELVRVFEGPLPLEVSYEDEYFRPGERAYYRMDMQGHGTLVSNPIFVDYRMNLEVKQATGG